MHNEPSTNLRMRSPSFQKESSRLDMGVKGSYRDMLQVIATVQAALPPDNNRNPTPISISSAIDVKFPTYDSSLSRLHHMGSGWVLGSPEIATRYWQACQDFQRTIAHQFTEVIGNLKSLEEFGGASDLYMQRHVAEGFSQVYEEWEKKLAASITQRYKKRVSSSDENAPTGKRDAIQILHRAFAVNNSPTDAERDYLAKQTGMTYRQVTVWFQNGRSRRINPIPKRGRQQSSQKDQQTFASPPQTGSTISSLHSIDQHLRNATDSPLAQHIVLPPTSSESINPHHTLRIPTPPFESSLLAGDDELENNSKLGIVSRSVSGIAGGGSAGGSGDGERKIKPLRKSRLAGKKAVVTAEPKQQDATTDKQTGNDAESRQPSAVATTAPLQHSPADILNHTKDQSRVSSTSSISTVDNLLDSDPSAQLFRSRNGSVLALPLSILNGRTVSGSSAGEVDASLGPDDILQRAGTEGMIPMFNFHPPTPSNAGFHPSNAASTTGTYIHTTCETPLQFEPIDFGTLFCSGAGDADKAAEGLLRDLDELDFGAFLNEGTSSEGSPEFVQGAFETRQEGSREVEAASGVDICHDGMSAPTLDTAQIEYIFEKMDAQNEAGDGMDIDPAIFEMLKGILTGSTGPTNDFAANKLDETDTPNIPPPPPNSTPIIDNLTFTSRPLSEYDPSLSALAIDLSALMNSSPRGSICIQTTPSDVSEMTAFEDFGGDVTPVAERPDVPMLGTDIGRVEGEGRVDWAGLVDFGDMFEAFWKMVDFGEGEGSAGQSL